MRSIQALGWLCIAAVGNAAVAVNAAQPARSPATLPATSAPLIVTSWQPRANPPPQDRLRHLSGSACTELAGCSTSAGLSPQREAAPEYDYIDALNLGGYGPMEFKFTGDRVKVKVRF